jgi:FtsP/CotA-like multicopper oxidase with cupredoxin domain
MKKAHQVWLPILLVCFATVAASAQSFRVQCPTSTVTHPTAPDTEPAYVGPTYSGSAAVYPASPSNVNGAIKCQQISGGDGYASMGDGTQTYLFAFGPLSGVQDIATGSPNGGTEFANVFNVPYDGPAQFVPGSSSGSSLNGAVGLADPPSIVGPPPNFVNVCATTPSDPRCNAGHVDPRPIMDMGVMNGNIPAPLMSIDEDDEFFLTLSNVGMIMRPDLFEQHTVHFHGYPNASSFYDGVPDASVAINIGGSFTYYYLAPDAGTYFWHCHITPPEHLQMGMVGQLYVRPRQNRFAGNLYDGLVTQQGDPRTACYAQTDTAHANPDVLCASPLPTVRDATVSGPGHYAYNDGDGSTRYDIEYPLQIHGFDPNFHFVGMTFNPEGFADMKDKYFLLNGRSYPDTVNPGALSTTSADGATHFSQPLPAIINIPAGGRALLRISDLDVSEYQTLASLGVPMQVIALNARLLRDQAGNNLYYTTNSITLAGGESLDVILDSCASRGANFACVNPIPNGTYYLYTPNLDHLSNDAENFGGLMTEVHIN